jgi:hypothetical protein
MYQGDFSKATDWKGGRGRGGGKDTLLEVVGIQNKIPGLSPTIGISKTNLLIEGLVGKTLSTSCMTL